MFASKITGTGLGNPSRLVTNDDLARTVATSNEWIQTRTGITSRRLIDREAGETHTTISVQAARQAMARANLDPQNPGIELVICCTATPETSMPISGARIVGALELKGCGSFDLNAACTGFVSGLHVADGLLRAGVHKRILVVGVDVFSGIIDWTDRATCVLFGDGAGAAILERCEDTSKSRIISTLLETDFDREEHLVVKDGGSRTPFPQDGKSVDGAAFRPFLQMNGGEVFKAGSRALAWAAEEILKRTDVDASNIDWFVPHQANLRMIEKIQKLLGLPKEKIYCNLDRFGNTSAATIPICLAEMEEKGLLKRGQMVLLDAFGAGFTYGSVLLRW